MNVFIDTSIVNCILDIEEDRPEDLIWQQDIKYIKLLLDGPVSRGEITFYVTPTVKWQIENTEDDKRRKGLQTIFEKFQFTEFNITVFPFHFPAKFISEEQGVLIEKICAEHPKLSLDRKIIADSAFDDNIDILLTTDRKLARQVGQIGKVRFMLPRQLWDYIQA